MQDALAALARLALVGALAASAPFARALDFGEPQLRSALGEPLDLRVPLAAAPGEAIDSRCLDAGPATGALPGIRGAVVTLEGPAAARIARVRTAERVDEPAVALQLRSGCPGAGALSSRDFNVLLEPRATGIAARPAIGAIVRSRGESLAALAATLHPDDGAARASYLAALQRANPEVRPGEAVPAGASVALPDLRAWGANHRPTRAAAAGTTTAAPAQPIPVAAAPNFQPGLGYALRLSSGALVIGRARAPGGATPVPTASPLALRVSSALARVPHVAAAPASSPPVQAARRDVPPTPASSLPAQAARQDVTPTPPSSSAQPAAKPAPVRRTLPPSPEALWQERLQAFAWWPVVALLAVLLAVLLAARAWRRRRAASEPAPRDEVAAPEQTVAMEPPAAEDEDAPIEVAVEPRPAISSDAALVTRLPENNAELRRRYIGERFPETEHGAIDLADPASVVKGARLFYEDGAVSRAIELLQFAIEDDPRRAKPWLALFEILRLERRAPEFAELAARFREAHGETGHWPKVRQVGREIDPGNPLYLAIPAVDTLETIGPREARRIAEASSAAAFDPIADNWLDAPMDFENEVLANDLRKALMARANLTEQDLVPDPMPALRRVEVFTVA